MSSSHRVWGNKLSAISKVWHPRICHSHDDLEHGYRVRCLLVDWPQSSVGLSIKLRLNTRTKGITDIASCLRCSYGYWIDYVRPSGLPHFLCSGVRAKRRCSGVMMAVTLQASYMNKLYAVHEGGQRTARTTKSLPNKICQESP